jgi:hypothetical protein
MSRWMSVGCRWLNTGGRDTDGRDTDGRDTGGRDTGGVRWDDVRQPCSYNYGVLEKWHRKIVSWVKLLPNWTLYK